MISADDPGNDVGDEDPRDEVHAHVLTPLFPREFVDHLRASAEAVPWPRSILYALEADLLDANRAAHESQVRGDRAGLNVAIDRRIDAAARINRFRDEQAERFLFGLANAFDRRPEETVELLDRIFGNELRRLREDLDDLADATLGRREAV
jgi:hypothetical protein